MMRTAVCSICPDATQLAHLELVRPSWEAYAQRFDFSIHIISTPPVPEHFYWGKYFLFDLPELHDYDAIIVLDNDILINSGAPSLVESWSPSLVGMVDERAQFGWNDEHVRRYYAHYDLSIPPTLRAPLVLNGGVLIYGREHVDTFRHIYQSWLKWRAAATESKSWPQIFKYANDQSHVGFALQTAGLVQALDPKFNRLWWSWWQNGGRRAELPFKIYAKSSKILTRWLPRALTDPLAAPGMRQIDRALEECYFLHFAGSKSPLHLLAHRRDHLAVEKVLASSRV
jgi:hypothetical protein